MTLVLGVNDEAYDPAKHHIISNASCTTNCLAPVAKVLLDEFGIERGFMTTTHAYTGDQMILDAPHKDLRRARVGGGLGDPDVDRRREGDRARDPGAEGQDGRHLDARAGARRLGRRPRRATSSREASRDEVNAALKANADTGRLEGILAYTEDPIVSVDIVGTTYSSIFDSGLTMANGPLVKVISWYDNEYGYSNRLVDLVQRV